MAAPKVKMKESIPVQASRELAETLVEDIISNGFIPDMVGEPFKVDLDECIRESILAWTRGERT